tara:strand:- start:179848 stop:181035 length:1188 start_codon:yes stop_codon:yes gene_type:complete
VAEVGSISHGDVGRLKSLLKQHDPRSLRDGETRRLHLSARDLNLVSNSVLPYQDRQALDIRLTKGSAAFNYSAALPDNPLGKYFNFSAILGQQEGRLTLEQLRFGNIRVPGWLLQPVVAGTNSLLRNGSAEYRDAMDALKQMQFEPNSLQLIYQWQSGLAERIQSRGRDLLLAPAEKQRIRIYYTEIMRQFPLLAGGSASLDRLLQPMFALARQRSENGHDAEGENRALLLALGVAINGSNIKHLTGPTEAASVTIHTRPHLVLQGRNDLVKHFIISAAITAGGGGGLADKIGVFKEVDDSRGGSGFSFPDLLADRAGVSFAEVALGDNARELQNYMSMRGSEADYMPGFTELPESLMALEFKSRYEDLDSATYALIDEEIERRIGSSAIHQSTF